MKLDKKPFVIMLISSISFLGCLTQSAQYASRPLYSITSNSVNSIDGPMYGEELLIVRGTSFSYGTRSITLLKLTTNDRIGYSFTLRLNSMNWQFLDTLPINIDGKTTRLKASRSDRNVISGNNVEETYVFVLDNEMAESIKKCTALKFQIGADVVEIPNEGIQAIHNFM